MAKIYGTHICSECDNEFSWEYRIPNHITDRYYIVERIIPENVEATRVSDFYDEKLVLKVKCKFCDNVDTFVYNEG